MRILFLSDNFPPESNAPASRVHEHAAVWIRRNQQVTVITCAPNFPDGKVYAGYENRWYSRERIDGIDVVRVKSYMAANEGFWRRTLDYVSFMVTGSIAGLFQARPDVVIGTTPQFFTAIGSWLVAAARRRPLVLEVRDLWPASIIAVGALKPGKVASLLESIELFLYRRASAIVSATSAFKADMVERGIVADKIHVVRAGVDTDRFFPRERDEELARELGLTGKFVVGYVGTHGMAHGLEHVLAAAARLADHGDVAFLFAGGGARRDALCEMVAEQGLDNVRMIGPQPKDRVPRIWSLCDVAVVPLIDRPLFRTVIPSKMIEAMAMGLPVVLAVPEGEATAMARKLRIGPTIAPEDAELLARTIIDLEASPPRREDYAAASLAAADSFSRERQADRMLSVLLDVTATDT